MNLFSWFHPKDKHVISKECHSKLPEKKKDEYIATEQVPTHYVETIDRE